MTEVVNEFDNNYIDLCKKIINQGFVQQNQRTKKRCATIFGDYREYDLSTGKFPLLTTKQMDIKPIAAELLGFIRGYTNAADFRKAGCKIWDANANKTQAWLDNPNRKGEDDLGRIYGAQARDWRKPDGTSVDQLKSVVERLNKRSDDRRLIVTHWNPGELDQMALPPCFKAGTLVLTKNGYKKIEDITKEDQVFCDDGSWDNVTEIFKTPYEKSLREIKLRYISDKIYSTSNHPFLIKDKGYIEIKDVDKSDFFAIKKFVSKNIVPEFILNVAKHCKFVESDKLKLINVSDDKNIRTYKLTLTEDDMYTLGYFVGDGWYTKKSKNRISFAIANKDVDNILPKIRKTIKISIKNDKRTANNAVRTYETKSLLWSNVVEQFGHKAFGKKIPQWVLDSPKEFREHFLNGYFSADGNFQAKNRELKQFVTTSRELALGIQILGSSLNQFYAIQESIRHPTCIIQGRTVNQRNFFTLREINLCNNKYLEVDEDFFWIKNEYIIESESTDFVYNFSTRRTHSYSVNNIITHNCHMTYMFGIESDKLHLSMVQRSMDAPLGCPYNIASYSLLLLLMCRITGLRPGKFCHFAWNAHIYQDQMDGIIHQITRQPYPAPSIWIDERIKSLEDLETWVTTDCFKMIDYQHHPKIVFPFSE